MSSSDVSQGLGGKLLTFHYSLHILNYFLKIMQVNYAVLTCTFSISCHFRIVACNAFTVLTIDYTCILALASCSITGLLNTQYGYIDERN